MRRYSSTTTPPTAKPASANTSELARLRQRAQEGDVEAQFELAEKLSENGPQRNAVESAKLYALAAAKGHVKAQNKLAGRYAAGDGVNQDFGKALKLYREAAVQGDAGSLCNLGVMYHHGLGVARNAAEALSYYQLAAKAGSTLGLAYYGQCVEGGIGIAANMKLAKEIYAVAAKQGEPVAMYRLGMCLLRDSSSLAESLPANVKSYEVIDMRKQAMHYLESSAKLGNSEAQLQLGRMYLEMSQSEDYKNVHSPVTEAEKTQAALAALSIIAGGGVTSFSHESTEAFRWLSAASEAGHKNAHALLGLAHINGRGVAINPVEAVRMFLKGADEGDEFSFYLLGECYKQGLGVPANRDAALQYYQLAAEAGLLDARHALAMFYLEAAEPNIPLGKQMLLTASDEGHAVSSHTIAMYLLKGIHFDVDKELALKYLRRAANENHPMSLFLLGAFYIEGINNAQNPSEGTNSTKNPSEGTNSTKNPSEGIELLRKAVNQDVLEAKYYLAQCYSNGEAVDLDFAEAMRLHKLAAEEGFAQSLNSIGVLYAQGHGVEQDFREAFRYFEAGAAKNDSTAIFNLGQCNEFGKGVNKDYIKAIHLYEKSASLGNKHAQERLKLEQLRHVEDLNPTVAKQIDVDIGQLEEMRRQASELQQEISRVSPGDAEALENKDVQELLELKRKVSDADWQNWTRDLTELLEKNKR
jgi:TPR repeat protein